jgi:hypothetical protein
MAKSYEVLGILIPNGGYVQRGDTYEGIEFLECEPITKAQYEAGFAAYDALKSQQNEAKSAATASAVAKLEAIGLTADEIAALRG